MVEFAEFIVNRESGIGCSWTPVGSSAVNLGPVVWFLPIGA